MGLEIRSTQSNVVEFSQFTKDLLDKVRTLKNAQIAYYEHLRKANTKWANSRIVGGVSALQSGICSGCR